MYVSQGYEQIPGGCRHSAHYRLASGEQGLVWWDVTGPAEQLPPRPSNDDLALVSLLFRAMNLGEDLHVEGPVSRSLLERCEEFVRIWTLWRPDLYRPIALTAASEVDDRPADPKRDGLAVAAFSGGVDAAATAWMHSQKLGGRASRDLFAAVLIQGFDVGLEDTKGFEATARACKLMLDDIGVPMLTLRTNWRAAAGKTWTMEFGLAVFSALKLWEDQAGTLLAGSCEDYSRLVVPWGSHPLPTRLLAARDTRLVYDGGHLNRTQKVKILSEWEVGYDLLRVCWAGDISGENCGICEKCTRTKLNAIVTGSPIPKTLGAAPTPDQVAALGPFNPAQRILMEEVLDEARLHNFKDERLLGAIGTALRRKPPMKQRIKSQLRKAKVRLTA